MFARYEKIIKCMDKYISLNAQSKIIDENNLIKKLTVYYQACSETDKAQIKKYVNNQINKGAPLCNCWMHSAVGPMLGLAGGAVLSISSALLTKVGDLILSYVSGVDSSSPNNGCGSLLLLLFGIVVGYIVQEKIKDAATQKQSRSQELLKLLSDIPEHKNELRPTG